MSELGRILTVGRVLLDGDRSAAWLSYELGFSSATLKRYVAELRGLGCQVVSRREASGWVYRLENASAVRARLVRWLELEVQRTLLES